MTTTAVSGASSATAPSNSLTMQDFLKVLFTQLTYQDPLKPMDNQQFMAQIAQYATLQQSQQTNENIAQLVTNQAALSSIGLIGRTVDVTTSSGPETGTVSALSLAGSSPQLTVTTSSGTVLSNVELSQITAVR
jgi:flagellar basal-body rod modification protein FlgD